MAHTTAFMNYVPNPDRYDEAFDAEGRPRGHWERLALAAHRASRAALTRRAQTIRRAIEQRGGTFLHLYACDLARSPDGRWWVINDRTQGPSGAGYALQNRLIVTPLYENIFRSLGVQRLANFFRTLQQQLAALAPTDGEPPMVALLTAGPYNETYFEHVFLARYLGYPLVEGSDLTVRDY